MEDVTLSALCHDDSVEVVKPEAISEQLREIGNDPRMSEQVPKGLTPGLGPRQHSAQIAPTMHSAQRFRASGERQLRRAYLNAVPLVVDGLVAGRHFAGSQRVLDHQVAVQRSGSGNLNRGISGIAA